MLKGRYELSVWQDVMAAPSGGKHYMSEERVAIIASDSMVSQNRAHKIKLQRKNNGEVNLSFSLYTKYVDMISGEEVENPFVNLLVNETKLKLKHNDKWYDLIINKVDDNSEKNICNYAAVDQHILELSKNGFNLVMDQSLFNNSGSLPELSRTILKDTDWEVDIDNSNICYQTVEESLVKLRVKPGVTRSGSKQITDPDENDTYKSLGGSIISNTGLSLTEGTTFYAFYSSCKEKPNRFQFIYCKFEDEELISQLKELERTEPISKEIYNEIITIDSSIENYFYSADDQLYYLIDINNSYQDIIDILEFSAYQINQDMIVINKNSQYVLDIIETNTQYQNKNSYGLFLPEWCDATVCKICHNVRGKKYVFTQKNIYNPVLKSYLYECKDTAKNSYIDTYFIPRINGQILYDYSSHYFKYCSPELGEEDKIKYYYNGGLGKITEDWSIIPNNADSKFICLFTNDLYTLEGSGSSNIGYSLQNFLQGNFGKYSMTYGENTIVHEPEKEIREGKEYYRIIFKEADNPSLFPFSPTVAEFYDVTNENIKEIQFNNSYINSNSFPVGQLNTVLKGAFWVSLTTGEYTLDTEEEGYIFDKNHTRFAIEAERIQDGETQYLISRILKVHEGRSVLPLSISFKKKEKGFILCFDNLENFVTRYSNDSSFEYIYALAETDTLLNLSNILVHYYISLSKYNSVQEENKESAQLFINKVQDNQAPYLTPIKDDSNKVQLKVKVEYALAYMREESEYMDLKTLYNLCGKSDFSDTVGWSTGIYATLLTNTDHVEISGNRKIEYSPLLYKGEVAACGALEVYTNMMNSAQDEDGNFSFPNNAVHYLTYTSPYGTFNYDNQGIYPVLISSGPFTQRLTIKNLVPKTDYIVLIKYGKKAPKTVMKIQVASHPYSSQRNCYYSDDKQSKVFLEYPADGGEWKSVSNNSYCFGEEKKSHQIQFKNAEIKAKYDNYFYMIRSVNDHTLTDQEFQKLRTQVFCTYNWVENTETQTFHQVDIEDIQIIPYIKDKDGNIITPKSDIEHFEAKKIYKYYSADSVLSAVKTEDLSQIGQNYDVPLNDSFPPIYYDNAEKIRSVNVKESNYFNSLSSLSETFQQWLKFAIKRDDKTGKVEEKKILFKNYSGGQSWAGFRYGANLKSISRTVDSKNIVTKMIVKNNSNVAAKNSSCSIRRAASNTIGENFILNFDYYIRQNLINAEQLNSLLYDIEANSNQPDATMLFGLKEKELGDLETLFNTIKNFNDWNVQGYFSRLSALNKEIEDYQSYADDWFKPLNIAISNLQEAEVGKSNANDGIILEEGNYYDITRCVIGDEGITYGDRNNDGSVDAFDISGVGSNAEARNTAMRWIQHKINFNNFTEKYTQALEDKEECETNYKKYSLIVDILNFCKSKLNLEFFHLFGAFIKEGTWIDEKYADDEEYYIDAKATMYNSCFPQVSYSISVNSLEWFDEYQYYQIELGDKSYVEDPEFFGYNIDGSPYQEEIVISEISEELDNPTAKSIKVQNYKTQFQDLFQRITATVQQAKYAEGSYQRAADTIQGSPVDKSQIVADALQDSEFNLSNGAQQSVDINVDGILITNQQNGSRLKLVGGAIYLSNSDLSKGGEWRAAITAQGISANAITTGQLNTNNITLFNGNYPTFRWDSLGLTAYEIKSSKPISDSNDKIIVTGINYGKGVRFDQFGVYGYNLEDSSDNEKSIFSPQERGVTSAEELLAKPEVKFALTWDGFKIVTNQGGKAIIGSITHTTTSDNGPLYEHNILEITQSNGQRTFVVNEDGTASFYGDFYVNGSGESPLLFVDQQNQKVEIAGWQVSEEGFQYEKEVQPAPAMFKLRKARATETYFAALSGKGLKRTVSSLTPEEQDWGILIGNNFGVTHDGKIYAIDAFLDGELSADKGEIGSWIIKNGYLIDKSCTTYLFGTTSDETVNGTSDPEKQSIQLDVGDGNGYIRIGITEPKKLQGYVYYDLASSGIRASLEVGTEGGSFVWEKDYGITVDQTFGDNLLCDKITFDTVRTQNMINAEIYLGEPLDLVGTSITVGEGYNHYLNKGYLSFQASHIQPTAPAGYWNWKEVFEEMDKLMDAFKLPSAVKKVVNISLDFYQSTNNGHSWNGRAFEIGCKYDNGDIKDLADPDAHSQCPIFEFSFPQYSNDGPYIMDFFYDQYGDEIPHGNLGTPHFYKFELIPKIKSFSLPLRGEGLFYKVPEEYLNFALNNYECQVQSYLDPNYNRIVYALAGNYSSADTSYEIVNHAYNIFNQCIECIYKNLSYKDENDLTEEEYCFLQEYSMMFKDNPGAFVACIENKYVDIDYECDYEHQVHTAHATYKNCPIQYAFGFYIPIPKWEKEIYQNDEGVEIIHYELEFLTNKVLINPGYRTEIPYFDLIFPVTGMNLDVTEYKFYITNKGHLKTSGLSGNINANSTTIVMKNGGTHNVAELIEEINTLKNKVEELEKKV